MSKLKLITLMIALIANLSLLAQFEGNTTPTYLELINIYEELAEEHAEIELYSMGMSDYGLPIYVCILNGKQDSLKTFEFARQSTTILINNGIHPGEPDGINACLIWINDWIEGGKKQKGMPVIGIIPAYNVGGMMNRSSTSRANQNGPEEYGFRGNAQNLDLNRDFIKMDSKNMFTFSKIFHGLDPDVFIDTHVSNGADYQYTLTYIASVADRMAPSISKLTHDKLLPDLVKCVGENGFGMVPYVNLLKEVPEDGMSVFNDLPRYSMGYASLFNTISFTVETHMLKPFKERTQATLSFLDETFKWVKKYKKDIEAARTEAFLYDKQMTNFSYNYRLSDDRDSLLFKGYEHTYEKSDVSGLERLKYHRDQPFEKFIPYANRYDAKDTLDLPYGYIIGKQCVDVIERLKANGVVLKEITHDNRIDVEKMKVIDFTSVKKPYEGHFLHNNLELESTVDKVQLKKGDFFIPIDQRNKRFIVSTLEAGMPDSYFAWNFFDSYLQQKEYFSAYVFEDIAKDLLDENPQLKAELEKKKLEDVEFAKSQWDQLYFIYKKSAYYEPTHNILPVFRLYKKDVVHFF
ncbi:MAG: hypothetical protein MK066_08505 [Crocinitomicaceae bacterium]|nr:hypothetical protein [Crocinitomicaceae bacterium]